ncbi:MAG: hypothetical protein ETSY2_27940 [Candidatus Entotheonella gemina]|uniref:Uncharacterized protein n=1 Tax=Candidatus Entotheonella gemina TaxID=1429439 RepID=W4M4M1_9BACT|nr:MAG: hypothetical protein ETSY2_27940 [Candidatus Entotheonella gemina]
MAELRLEYKEAVYGLRQDIAVLVKTVETLSQQIGDMRQDMRDLKGQMERFQANTQRQMWVMISVISGTVIVGLMKLIFFPTP